MSRGTLDPAGSALASDTGLSPSLAGCSKAVLLPLLNPLCSPNPAMHASRFGLFRVRSPLLTESNVSFSSSGYLDVSVPRVPFHKLWIHLWMTVVHTAGFPHSEISGSKDICSSPKLIAAYHVFHRLPVPRHSPCALVRLTFQTFFQNIWYPLDSLLLPTKIIVTLPFEIAIFLKRTYYNLCFAVIIQFSRYVLVMFLKARSPETLIFITWWAKMDSNHRPHDYQSCALAS